MIMAMFQLACTTLKLGFSCSTCVRALESLTQVEQSMDPPLQIGNCELGVSENDHVIYAATVTTMVVM